MQTLTGVAADPTTSPQISCVADLDTGNASNLAVTPLQPVANFIAWIRGKMARTDDNGGARIQNVGTPSASGDAATKGYVDAAPPLAYGNVASSGAVNASGGSAAVTVVRTGVGVYTISHASITANAIIVATLFQIAVSNAAVLVAPAAGVITVRTVSSGSVLNDMPFMFALLKF